MRVRAKYGVRTCPHLFDWNNHFYFMGGNTIWTSPQPFGPWTIHSPVRLEQLSVPKTAEKVELPVTKAVQVEIICRHDIVDVEINGRRTLANRYWDTKGDRVSLWVEKGGATFRNLQIRPLVEPPEAQ